MKDFKLQNLRDYRGYINKADITNVKGVYLVKGSQNVVSTDEGRLGTSKGYSLLGSADTTLEPITSEYSWLTARGDEIIVRGRDDASTTGTLEFYHSDIGAWTELVNSLGTGSFNFTTYWDTGEAQDALIFVCNDPNIYYWSGGVATFASATANTITKQGTTTWAEEGFIEWGTTKVLIEGTEYTYTGGTGTTTLTGVTPDPTSAGHAVGACVHQSVRTQSNTPSATINNALIATHRNQVYLGSLTRRDLYVSKVGDYTDYTFSTPRAVGEGALLTLNEAPTAFVPQEDSIYFSTYNQWYDVMFTLSDDLQNEELTIRLLESSPMGGAVNQSSVFKAKKEILYISNEPTINSFGRIESIDTPQSQDLSDPIKLELEGYNLTNCSGKFYRNNAYFNFPSEGKTLIYNIAKGYWEAPQVLPVRVMSIWGGELYGHSNGNHETYKLLDGTNANGKAMQAVANFAYLNYGQPSHMKGLTEWFTDGYISTNTTLTQTLYYDFKGYSGVQEFDIKGDDTAIIFANITTGNLGKEPLGKEPLGTTSDDVDELQRFRVIKQTYKRNFYEIQVKYESNDIDQQWFLLHQGGNAMLSKDDNFSIKQ
jgi:hypothetical protein